MINAIVGIFAVLGAVYAANRLVLFLEALAVAHHAKTEAAQDNAAWMERRSIAFDHLDHDPLD